MNSLVLDNSVAMRWCFKDGSDTDLAYAEKVLDSLSDTLFLVPKKNCRVAAVNGLILVTRNTDDFSRFAGLQLDSGLMKISRGCYAKNDFKGQKLRGQSLCAGFNGG